MTNWVDITKFKPMLIYTKFKPEIKSYSFHSRTLTFNSLVVLLRFISWLLGRSLFTVNLSIDLIESKLFTISSITSKASFLCKSSFKNPIN